MERAKLLKQGRKLGLSNYQLGEIVGRSEAHVHDLLSLVRLPAEQQTAMRRVLLTGRFSTRRGSGPAIRRRKMKVVVVCLLFCF